MLYLSEREKEILDALLSADPKTVAQKLGVPVQTVYDVKTDLKRKAQNAQDFLAVVKSKYGSLLSRRVKSPSIMPKADEEPLEIEKHNNR